MKRLFVLAIVAVSLVAACGSSTPSDVQLLTRACKVRPEGSGYDWRYATRDRYGVITGVANCNPDGSVANWGMNWDGPPPTGHGDQVYLLDRGQP